MRAVSAICCVLAAFVAGPGSTARADCDCEHPNPAVDDLCFEVFPSACDPIPDPPTPPSEDDRTFLWLADPPPPCITREHPLEMSYDVLVDRVVGEVDVDEYLVDPQGLIAQGRIGVVARLTIAAWDVDRKGSECYSPEVDLVKFNGESVRSLRAGNSPYLRGGNNRWHVTRYRIPIEKVKFPAEPADWRDPAGEAINQISINENATDQCWCTSIAWIALQIKATSPVVLLHGLGQTGEYFENFDFTDGLSNELLLWNNDSIHNSTPSTIATSGRILAANVKTIARHFGVDSAHLVAHSKGGLDSMEYLARHMGWPDPPVRPVSLTTLDSPIQGSALADIAVGYGLALEWHRDVRFIGFPFFEEVAVRLITSTFGDVQDLTTWRTARFRLRTLYSLSNRNMDFYTIGSDMDLNSSGHINLELGNDPDETLSIRQWQCFINPETCDFPPLIMALGLDAMYRMLGTYRTVEAQGAYDRNTGRHLYSRLVGVSTSSFQENDVLVTIDSAHGKGDGEIGFNFKDAVSVKDSHTFNGSDGRSHANVADLESAAIVAQWIRDTAFDKGDMRPWGKKP